MEYTAFVDSIANGAGTKVDMSMLGHVEDPRALLDFVFPAGMVDDPIACAKRYILAPTHRQVDSYNRLLLDRVTGNKRRYLAADTLEGAADIPVEVLDNVLDYATRCNFPDLPAHSLRVKENGVYRLLHPLNPGVPKNTRGVVTHVGEWLVTMRILRPNTTEGPDDDLLIPRIPVSYALPSGYTLQRRQFPVAPAYVTTFDTCQGLTLDRVGVDLTAGAFPHEQLYTALSRIQHRNHARILFMKAKLKY